MSSMNDKNAVRGWLPARIYSTPSGFLFGSIGGSFETSANAVCPHGPAASAACACGYTSMADREAATEEMFGMPLVEVMHLRETVWTDGTLVRGLTQDVVRVHLTPECHECFEHAETLTLMPGSTRGSSRDRAVEVACYAHLGVDGALSIDALSNGLGVDVCWSSGNEMSTWMVKRETEAIMAEAMNAVAREKIAERLDDLNELDEWAKSLLVGGPEAFMVTVAQLNLLPVEMLRAREHSVKHLMTFVGEEERAALQLVSAKLNPEGMGASLAFLVELAK